MLKTVGGKKINCDLSVYPKLNHDTFPFRKPEVGLIFQVQLQAVLLTTSSLHLWHLMFKSMI